MQLSFLAPFAFLSLVLASSIPNSVVKELKERSVVKKQAALTDFLALLLADLPEIDAPINDVTGVLTDFEELLADALDIQTTENELGGPCTEYTIIFARGTTEPGNVGVLVGPELFDALEYLVGTSALTLQGVNDYAASVEGYLDGGDTVGSAEMYVHITYITASFS
jgi:cutinase